MLHFEKDDAATHGWLQSLRKSTSYIYRSHWRLFLDFTGMTGDQILAAKKADEEHLWERKVIEFKDWLVNEKGFAEHTARTATGCIRGFFAYWYAKLEYRKGDSRRLDSAMRKTEDYRFSLQDLKKMYDFADLNERYIITAGKSFGLRAGDFLRISRGDLEPYLDREVPISIGAYATEKEAVQAYPFIDADALAVIKAMLETMDREGRTEPNERILTYRHTVELSRALRRAAKRAGIKSGDKRIRFHCMRKFLIDRLSSFMSSEKWKMVVGKAITEAAYVSPDSLHEDYSRAMPETTFTKAAEGDVAKVAKLEILKHLMKSAGFTEDDLRDLLTSKAGGMKGRRGMARRTPLPIDEQIAALEEALKQGKGDCEDGEHCGESFKEIPESELLACMKDGWQIQYRLNNGNVIVKR